MKQGQADHSSLHGKAENSTQKNLLERAMQNLNLIELIECNSALAKLSAVQKRHLESLAEGPVFYRPDQCLWKAGATADKAFIIVEKAFLHIVIVFPGRFKRPVNVAEVKPEPK